MFCFLLRPRERWQSIVISSSVCPCVCLSDRIYRKTRARSLTIFLHVAYGRGSVLLRQGDEIPSGKDQFWKFSSPLTMHRNACSATNVTQQKNRPFRRCRGWWVRTARAKCDLRLPCYEFASILPVDDFACVGRTFQTNKFNSWLSL